MGAGKMPDIDEAAAEKSLSRTEAIIYSMTPEERQNPSLLNPSRKRRIAVGAGVDIAEVNRLVKQFEQMKKMMKQMYCCADKEEQTRWWNVRQASVLMLEIAYNAF